MKRILQVTGGMNRAGAETMIMNIYRQLDYDRIQFDFVVYGEEKQDYEEEILDRGGKVFHLPLKSGVEMLKSIKMISNIMGEKGEYSAIHIHTLHNSLYALIAALKYKNIIRIVHSHTTQNDGKKISLKKIYEIMTRFFIKKFSHFWYACGEEAGIYLFGEEFKEKGFIINNAIDLDMFTKDYSEEIYQLQQEYNTEGNLIIGHVGRLESVKNHRFMIDVAEELLKRNLDFKMFFVGKGNLEKELVEIVKMKDLESHVIFCGVRSDIPVLLQFFDVFFLPSQYEGNPVTLIEAQASGTPCLISDVITEKIDVGLKLINRVSLNNTVSEWANKLTEISRQRISDKEIIKKQLGKSGYNVRVVANDLVEVYSNKRREI